MGIKKAKTKEIRRLTPAELGVDPEGAADRQKLHRIYVPLKTKKTQFIDGQPKEAAAKLVEHLKNDVRIL